MRDWTEEVVVIKQFRFRMAFPVLLADMEKLATRAAQRWWKEQGKTPPEGSPFIGMEEDILKLTADDEHLIISFETEVPMTAQSAKLPQQRTLGKDEKE